MSTTALRQSRATTDGIPRQRPAPSNINSPFNNASTRAAQDARDEEEEAYPGPLTAQSWKDRARCAVTDPEAFFPEKGGSVGAAKASCAQCLVRDECLSYALRHDERFGVWGGLTERERRRLKRRA